MAARGPDEPWRGAYPSATSRAMRALGAETKASANSQHVRAGQVPVRQRRWARAVLAAHGHRGEVPPPAALEAQVGDRPVADERRASELQPAARPAVAAGEIVEARNGLADLFFPRHGVPCGGRAAPFELVHGTPARREALGRQR